MSADPHGELQPDPGTTPNEPAIDSTLDAFHRGDFWLVQPARSGHRAGVDAMMLAAAVPDGFSGRLVDFGAGSGAAGLAVASRCKDSRVVLVEREPEMAAFARMTLAHPGNNHLVERVALLEADVTLSGKARVFAGMPDAGFDFAIMNPPFNVAGDRASPHALRRSAHVMDDGLFESWLRSAAAVVKPRGGLAIIARPVSLGLILAALGARFGAAQVMPIHPRADQPAIRVILRAVRGSRAPLSLMPPLVLHGPGETFTKRAIAVTNGRTSLFDD